MYGGCTIYFLSGTGNSYRVAAWMAEAARAGGVPTDLAPMSRDAPPPAAGPGHLLGLALPTHGFTAPWTAIRFVLRLPRRPGAHAFVGVTRAGTRVGSRFFPGMMGTAGHLLAAILALKGYEVRGVQAFDMPSSWQALHPGVSRATAEAIAARTRPRAERFTGAILAGGRAMAGQVELALGLLLAPVSLAYLLMGRLFLAKTMFASEGCDGCGVCAAACPSSAIRMWGKERPRPYWTFACESCMRCIAYCPRGAIEANLPYAALAYYAVAAPAVAFALERSARKAPWLQHQGARQAAPLLRFGGKVAAVYLAYLVLTLLLRLPAFNRAFTAIAPTRYWRRYREPSTRLRHLTARRDRRP